MFLPERTPISVRVAVALQLKLIFLFDTEIIVSASFMFSLTMAVSNEVVHAVDEKQHVSELHFEAPYTE